MSDFRFQTNCCEETVMMNEKVGGDVAMSSLPTWHPALNQIGLRQRRNCITLQYTRKHAWANWFIVTDGVTK